MKKKYIIGFILVILVIGYILLKIHRITNAVVDGYKREREILTEGDSIKLDSNKYMYFEEVFIDDDSAK